MGAKTEISWTDSTWNPVRGCSMAKGSEAGGCLNCYAARLNARNLPELKSPTTGESFARILPSGPRWTGKVELIESQLLLPLKWRKPKRIFVNSMSDLFHEALTDEQIDRVFAVMALCPQHTFQILTKRPERMLAYSSRFEGVMTAMRHMGVNVAAIRWPLPNIWMGVSVENQATADARIPLLLQTPAAVRFVSYEPALGPVDFAAFLFSGVGSGRLNMLHQVIIGGESGPGARPFDIQWARNTIQQCGAAGVACFVKQLGAKPIQPRSTGCDKCDSTGHTPHGFRDCQACKGTGSSAFVPDYEFHLKDRKGGDMSEWEESLRVRQFPVTA